MNLQMPAAISEVQDYLGLSIRPRRAFSGKEATRNAPMTAPTPTAESNNPRGKASG